MNENNKNMEIALFRYGMISDFINQVQFPKGKKQKLIKFKCQQEWKIPNSDRKRISESTLRRWIRIYHRGGQTLESLCPHGRNDKNKFRVLTGKTEKEITHIVKRKDVKIVNDIMVKMKEKMYQKRLNGYASMGYKAKSEELNDTPLDIIFDKDNFLPVFNRDINAAEGEILFVSPFVRKIRTLQMIKQLKVAIDKKIRVLIITRPKEDFKSKDHATIQNTLGLLTDSGASVVFKSNIHQKFAIMDQKIVWYGSINLLSYGSAQESIMRIESSNIANELMKSIERA